MDGRVQVDDVGWRFDRVKVGRQSLQDTQKTCQLQSTAGTTRKEQQEWTLDKMECLSRNYFVPVP